VTITVTLALTVTLTVTLALTRYSSALLGVHVLSSSEPTYPQLLLGAPTSPPPSAPPLGGPCARTCRSQTCLSFLGDFTCEVSELSG
jgi:hypothetical protein